MNYTKGKWKAYTNIIGTFSHVFIPGKYTIAEIVSSNPDDACLIAAAPEMYEALKVAQVELAANIDRTKLIRLALLKVERALAKAEGK